MSNEGSKELCDFDLNLVFETNDAFCVSEEEDTFHQEAKRFWLPKSIVEYDGKTSFTMPMWLAEKKGLA